MKALARALATAAVLVALGVLAAGTAHASPPQVDQGSGDRQHATQPRHGKVWRCNSGHGPQFDCAAAGWLAGSQPSPDPTPVVPAGGGSPFALTRSLALLGLLVALAAGGDWLRRHHRPPEAT
jgi:hypothetical protein